MVQIHCSYILYVISTTFIIYFARELIEVKVQVQEISTFHPFYVTFIYFFGKALCYTVYFLSDESDEEEEIVPISELAPNQSTSEITPPHISQTGIDYTGTCTINHGEKKKFHLSSVIIPSIINIFSMSLIFYSMSHLEFGVFTTEYLIGTSILFASICAYSKYYKIFITIILGLIVYGGGIIFLTISYGLKMNWEYFSAVFMCFIGVILEGVVFYFNNVRIPSNYEVSLFKLHSIEGIICTFIYIFVLIASNYIPCPFYNKINLCNGEHFEEIGNIFNFEQGNETFIRVALTFGLIIAVIVFFKFELKARKNMEKYSYTFKDVPCLLLAWIYYYLKYQFNKDKYSKIIFPSITFGVFLLSNIILNSIIPIDCFNELKLPKVYYQENENS